MNAAETALWPASALYGAVVRARAWAYRRGLRRPARLPCAVVSIGNLTVGGTGKTPMIFEVAQRWLRQGKRVGILTRGYRGFLRRGTRGVRIVCAGESVAGNFGDEPSLLLKRLSEESGAGDRLFMGVGADRAAAGRALVRLGVECLLLDDGFQHFELARDVDVVMVDATKPFGGGHLLPAGRLREPKTALRRADILVITRSGRAPAAEAALQRFSLAPIFYAETELERITRFYGNGDSGDNPNAELPPEGPRYFAFCGIGNPKAFFEDCARWGLNVTARKAFADHHVFSGAEMEELRAMAARSGANALLCTEKDTFNLPPGSGARLEIFYARIRLRLGRNADFWRALDARLAENRQETRA
jgi:tetraacyldisaccharide 4'-kinase